MVLEKFQFVRYMDSRKWKQYEHKIWRGGAYMSSSNAALILYLIDMVCGED